MAQPNFDNRTLFEGDNLPVLRGLNSETIDLIATDPPFNKGRDFHATPDSLASGAKFADRWSWQRDVHQEWVDAIQDDEPAAWSVIDWSRMSYGDDMGAFLCFIGVRLLEMRRILKPTGSIYLHCDPTASHYLKALMDAVFGRKQFRNEIVWAYRKWTNASESFQRNHDVLLYYTKSAEWSFNKLRREETPRHIERGYTTNTVLDGGRRITQLLVYDRAKAGSKIAEGRYDRVVYRDGDDQQRVALADWWEMDILNSQALERTGYPTQKPLALYDRIIRASSNEGDWVLDPFAGCATTPIAAELAGRKWLAIDLWDGTAEVTRKRLADAIDAEGAVRATRYGEAPEDAESARLPIAGEIHHRTDLPERTDEGEAASPPLKSKSKSRPIEPQGPKLTRAEMIDILLEQQDSICAGCDRAYDDPRIWHLDHKLPRSEGGVNHISNRALLCPPCNQIKSDKLTLTGLRALNKKNDWMAR